jgi:hypothetical protein
MHAGLTARSEVICCNYSMYVTDTIAYISDAAEHVTNELPKAENKASLLQDAINNSENKF